MDNSIKMSIIYKALEDGWSVKRSETDPKTFEFTKGIGSSIENELKVIKSIKSIVCKEILSKQLENEQSIPRSTRSVSTPIIKNNLN
jgi:hypothetical protein